MILHAESSDHFFQEFPPPFPRCLAAKLHRVHPEVLFPVKPSTRQEVPRKTPRKGFFNEKKVRELE